MHNTIVEQPARRGLADARGADPVPLLGPTPLALNARAAFGRALARRSPVLVTCEAGCRPGAIAEALHARSRPLMPFLSADCGATDPLELELRLFGSPAQRRGPQQLERVAAGAALLAVDGGTLFLENIDELPAASQRRLARVLRDGEMACGDGRVVPAGFRLVVSTARELEAEVRDGRFRADLLRRLTACPIAVPPLRQRAADLPAIIARLFEDVDLPPRSFTQPALTVLAALPWNGNVDELAQILARIAASAGGSAAPVRQEDVLVHLPIGGAFAPMDLTASLREARHRFERDYIAAVLERHRWRMSDAARTLGIERANLYRKTRQLGIKRGAVEAERGPAKAERGPAKAGHYRDHLGRAGEMDEQ